MNAIHLPVATERDAELGAARAMTPADFAILQSSLRDHAVASLLATGSLEPAIFLPGMGSQEGQIARMGVMPVGDLMSQPVGKTLLAGIMARLLEDANHDFVVFAHEAWVLVASDPTPEKLDQIKAAMGGSLEHHPDRTEAVVLQLRSKTRTGLCIMPITRDESGKVASLEDGPIAFSDEPGNFLGGRLAPQASETRPPDATLH